MIRGKVNGTIDSTSACIDNVGTTILGTKDGNIQNNIELNSENVGIRNGELYYYDGIIHAQQKEESFYSDDIEEKTVEGCYIEEIEENSIIKLTREDMVFEHMELGQDEVAQVGENKYTNLQDAVDACVDNESQEILLLKNVVITAQERVSINENKNITLNLNDKIIKTYSHDYGLNNAGNLFIKGLSENSKLYADKDSFITNSLEFRMDDVTLNGNKNVISNTGSFNLNNSNITAIYDAIYNNSNSESSINGGKINITTNIVGRYGISNDKGTITINDLDVDGIINKGTINFVNGNVSNMIYNDAGQLIIQNGTIHYVLNNIGTTTIQNGTINGTVSNAGIGTINIESGELKSTEDYSVYNKSSGIVNVTGGTVEGIQNESSGTINVTGGNVISEKADGIYNMSNGTVNVGTEDGDVDWYSLMISGKVHGVYNSTGTFNFFDGTLGGLLENSIYGSVNRIESGSSISKYYEDAGTIGNYEINEGYEASVLEVRFVAEVDSTGEKYTNTVMQEAANQFGLLRVEINMIWSDQEAIDYYNNHNNINRSMYI